MIAVPAPATPELPAKPDVVIGPMRRRHLRGVLRIEQQVSTRPWSLGLFMSELGQRSNRVYITARVGGSVVGYAGLMLVPDDGHVTTISVDPALQRHRIGTRLLLVLARTAAERGARNLTLEVRVDNAPAQALYRAFGFAPAGVRKGYYGEGNDALVMWAHDVHLPSYQARLERLESRVPGTTTVEDVRP